MSVDVPLSSGSSGREWAADSVRSEKQNTRIVVPGKTRGVLSKYDESNFDRRSSIVMIRLHYRDMSSAQTRKSLHSYGSSCKIKTSKSSPAPPFLL